MKQSGAEFVMIPNKVDVYTRTRGIPLRFVFANNAHDVYALVSGTDMVPLKVEIRTGDYHMMYGINCERFCEGASPSTQSFYSYNSRTFPRYRRTTDCSPTARVTLNGMEISEFMTAHMGLTEQDQEMLQIKRRNGNDDTTKTSNNERHHATSV